jgi:processive 1,2-diacylglycerol beta-glucosyltransferase
MIKLYDSQSGAEIGVLSDAQLRFLVNHLEEESSDDRDYYINLATLDSFEAGGADPELMALLRRALGSREDMDIRWTKS